MIIAVHAVRTEGGAYHVRLVLTPNLGAADPALDDVLEAVSTAIWSLGYPSRADTHTVLAWAVPRQAVRMLSEEIVRVSVQSVALWRETEIALPDGIALPFTMTV